MGLAAVGRHHRVLGAPVDQCNRSGFFELRQKYWSNRSDCQGTCRAVPFDAGQNQSYKTTFDKTRKFFVLDIPGVHTVIVGDVPEREPVWAHRTGERDRGVLTAPDDFPESVYLPILGRKSESWIHQQIEWL